MILGENLGVQAIRGVLPEMLEATERHGEVVVFGPGIVWRLRSVWAGEGFPADLTRAFESENLPSRGNQQTSVIPVITARRLSKGARRELEARGYSWADLTGRGRIEADPGLFIYRASPSVGGESPAVLRWSRSAGAVAETMLHLAVVEPGTRDNVDASRLSDYSAFSYGQVNKVLQDFETAGYVRKSGPERGANSRRSLIDPSRLLSDWAGWHRRRSLGTVEMNTPWREVDRSLSEMRDLSGGSWAATGWYAADLLAPFSTSVPTLSCYVVSTAFASTVGTLIEHGDFSYASERGRFSITPAERHVLGLSEEISGVPTVSPIRIYGDLARIGARGEEAAQHLRETVLGY